MLKIFLAKSTNAIKINVQISGDLVIGFSLPPISFSSALPRPLSDPRFQRDDVQFNDDYLTPDQSQATDDCVAATLSFFVI